MSCKPISPRKVYHCSIIIITLDMQWTFGRSVILNDLLWHMRKKAEGPNGKLEIRSVVGLSIYVYPVDGIKKFTTQCLEKIASEIQIPFLPARKWKAAIPKVPLLCKEPVRNLSLAMSSRQCLFVLSISANRSVIMILYTKHVRYTHCSLDLMFTTKCYLLQT